GLPQINRSGSRISEAQTRMARPATGHPSTAGSKYFSSTFDCHPKQTEVCQWRHLLVLPSKIAFTFTLQQLLLGSNFGLTHTSHSHLRDKPGAQCPCQS